MSNIPVKFCIGNLSKFDNVAHVPRYNETVQLSSGLTFRVNDVFHHKDGVSVRGIICTEHDISGELVLEILEKQFGWTQNDSNLEKFNGLSLIEKPEPKLVIEDIDSPKEL